MPLVAPATPIVVSTPVPVVVPADRPVENGIADVTATVKGLAASQSLKVFAANSALGWRPFPGAKEAQVEYTIDNVVMSKVVLEGKKLCIRVPSGKVFVVTKATYGKLPDDIMDVTDTLAANSSRTNSPSPWENDALDGDPAPFKDEGAASPLYGWR